jgi:hypothetical protein
MSNKPRVLIASPTPGSVKTRYMKAIIATMRDLAQREIGSDYVTADGSEIVTMRNDLATLFLNKRDFTHLFCVDSDMAFRPELCWRMIAADKPVVGIIAPRRSVDFPRVEQVLKAGAPLQIALQMGLTWYYRREGTKGPPAPAPMLEVDWLGFGVTLVKRETLETMIARGAAKRQATPEAGGGERYNFFGMREEDVGRDEHTTEDVSFCRRWKRDCGGQLWALTDEIIHIGDFGYGGSYFEVLRALERAGIK